MGNEKELSKHPTKGYRLSIGYYLKDGKRMPRVWWLGQSPAEAYVMADLVRYAYDEWVTGEASRFGPRR